jgi:hypothetical protein
MRIYEDSSLNKEVALLDFGIVPAGSIKKFTFYVYNESNAYYKDLKFTVEHPEVVVIKAPLELKSRETKKIIFEWKPSVTVKEGLKAQIRVQGIELWG